MAKVLVVYENIPENTDIYLLDDVAEADLKWMAKCHLQFINTEMSAAAEKACEKLSLYLEKCEKVKSETAVDIRGYDLLIVTGFLL